jgi:hypothetical protein
MMKNSKEIFKKTGIKAFKVTSCIISFSSSRYIDKIKLSCEWLDDFNIKLKFTSEQKEEFLSLVEKEDYTIKLKIFTYIDKDFNFFPMMFGYPIKNFETNMEIKSDKVNNINIVPFFNTNAVFKREDVSTSTNFVKGGIEHLTLSDSALILKNFHK